MLLIFLNALFAIVVTDTLPIQEGIYTTLLSPLYPLMVIEELPEYVKYKGLVSSCHQAYTVIEDAGILVILSDKFTSV
jgi:hypothetical protein